MLRVACVGLASSAVVAQVSPPPPAKPEATPAVEPPKPQQRRPAPEASTPRPDESAAEGKPATKVQANEKKKLPRAPSIPYDGITVLDADGNIVDLGVSTDRAALQNNPIVGPSDIPTIQLALLERRDQVCENLIEHLDLVEQVDGGLFENVTVDDGQEVSNAMDVVRLLNAKGTLTDYMLEENVLTPIQLALSNKIAQEHRTNMGAVLARKYPDMRQMLDAYTKWIMHDTVYETMKEYENLVADAGLYLPTILKQVGVPASAEAASISELVDARLRFERTRDFLAANVPLEKRREALLLAMQWRQPPEERYTREFPPGTETGIGGVAAGSTIEELEEIRRLKHERDNMTMDEARADQARRTEEGLKRLAELQAKTDAEYERRARAAQEAYAAAQNGD
jgi:hypothetical protein